MRRNKLSFRIAIWIICGSFILTVFSSMIILKLEYNDTLKTFEQSVTDINFRNKNTLQHILWIYDTSAIQKFLLDIVDGNQIIYAQIALNDEKIFSAGTPQKEDILHKEFHIMHNQDGHEYHIGHFTVLGNLKFVKEKIIHKAITVWLSEVFKAIIMTLLIVWLLKEIFVNHLEQLAIYTKKLNLSNLKTPFLLERKHLGGDDEISTVVDAFNDMRINLFNEIEKSKKVEKELIAFKNAVENSYNVIVITNLEKKITYVNDVFEEVTGYAREEVIGKDPNILKSNLHKEEYYTDLHETISQGKKWEGEFVNKRKDGTIFYERASIIPIVVDNEVVNYLAIKLDITQYKESVQKIKKLNFELENRVKERTATLEKTIFELMQTKDQLIEAEKIAFFERDKAQEASRAKSVFLANISHELKTPLNGINGLAYLSQIKANDKELINNLISIQLYSNNLLRLITDLLDASKSESKELKIINEPFDFQEMLQTISQTYQKVCEQKGLLFSFINETHPLSYINSDAVRLYQILTNLLNNAVKFTHNGEVRLSIKVESFVGDRVNLYFEVKDSGIGIEPKELEYIFSPFYQTEVSRHNFAEGSGLGLNICQSLIEQMNGKISVFSKLDQGSIFSVSLSLEVAHALSARVPIEYSLNQKIKSYHILVVDDKKINQDIVCGILDTLNIQCSRANDGYEAVEKIKINSYDLILMDIKMPKMDGYECTKTIRQDLRYKSIPIIALSANNSEEDILLAKECGMNDYISKPIYPEYFIEKISMYLALKANSTFSLYPLDDESILDTDDAMSRFVNNKSLYMQTLREFLEEYENAIQITEQFFTNKNQEDFLVYLHTLKGLSSNLSARFFAKIVSEMHEKVKNNQFELSLFERYKKGFIELQQRMKAYLDHEAESEIFHSQVKIPLEEVMTILKSFLEQQNTQALSYFQKVKASFLSTPLLKEFEYALNNYEFKKCIEMLLKLK